MYIGLCVIDILSFWVIEQPNFYFQPDFMIAVKVHSFLVYSLNFIRFQWDNMSSSKNYNKL